MKLSLFFKRLLLVLTFLIVHNLAFSVPYSGSLPVMYIQTENATPIQSKDTYVNATYYIDAMGVEGMQDVASATAPLSMEIKGRGNYTWSGFDKKPYRIKLSEKQALLGMQKSMHFALLAHADDNRGFTRNAIGFYLSRMIGLAWTPEAKPLELVLNGEYVGLYFLTETIRVGADRVNIIEQDDEEITPSNITGGWLVEIDNYDDSPNVKITEGDGARIIFTYKSPEVLSTEQETFLRDEMTRINNLVYGDKNSDEIWQLVDIDALARFYIVQEIVDNYESFHGSCYLYRDRGENAKWHFGPVWDFGSAFNYDKSQYIYQGREHHMTWIKEFCRFPVFQDYVKTLWQDFYKNQFDSVFLFTQQHISLLSAAATADAKRWPNYGNADLNNRVEKINQKLRSAAKWLNKEWGNNLPNDDNAVDENATTSMLVWVNGQPTEYPVASVDSITFVKKAGITVRAKVPAAWTDKIYVWIWGDDITTNEFVAEKQGDWYVYTHNGDELNIIYKNGKGWTGKQNQTEDIYTTKSECYQLQQSGESKATAIIIDCE